jgi:hypothetical protein
MAAVAAGDHARGGVVGRSLVLYKHLLPLYLLYLNV